MYISQLVLSPYRISALIFALVFCFGLTLSPAAADTSANSTQAAPNWTDKFAQLSIAELINIEVTSAGKKAEQFSDVASAIFVITNEDIRRSGATSIPEALRMVPGLNVARIDNSQYAISSRGFQGLFSDKLLVLIDGRSVYTPLFGGVFWNEQDTLLEDIDRIEVIRGPGATLWGANAVNGVINIITKSASDTQGGLVTAGGGNQERGFASARYGDKVADTNYRMYAKTFDRDDNRLEEPGRANDDWRGARAGFRTDTECPDCVVTLQGDYYYGESGWNSLEPLVSGGTNERDLTRYHNGGNLLGRWTENLSEVSELSIQGYYDHTDRNDYYLNQSRNTFDLEVQHRYSGFKSHDLLYGGQYRVYRDSTDDSFSVQVDPSARTLHLFTGFIQDEITLVPEQLKLIVGTKLEHNDLSGLEVLPNVRAVVTPDEKNTVWGAVSRAVRSPARFNHDGRLVLSSTEGDQGLANVATLYGQDDYDSENLIAYELGYRFQVGKNLSFDLAGFYNDYSDLESAEPRGAPGLSDYRGTPFIEIPFQVENLLAGDTYGGEAVIDWRPIEDWRLIASYAYVKIDLSKTGGSQDFIFSGGEGQTAQNQAMLRSQVNLPYDLEFDTALRFVDSIPTFSVDSYLELDVRLGWHASKNWEFSVAGQNLLDSAHLEYASNLVDTRRTEIQRGVYGKATYRF